MDKRYSVENLIMRLCASIILLVVVCFSLMFSSVTYASASSVGSNGTVYLVDGYSGVLTDLGSDVSFDVDSYPADDEDYSLSIVQIAESDEGELFLYVYQPYTAGLYDLTAGGVSISLTVGDGNLSYKVYTLSLLNYCGTLYKYRVNNLTVSASSVHYYAISTIYRPYYSSIDSGNVGDNTTNGLGIAVGQEWQVSVIDGEKYYWCDSMEYLEITPYVSFVDFYVTNYDDFRRFYFLSFSTDFDIDEVYEADISFVYTTTHIQNGYSLSQGTIDTNDVIDYYDYYETPLTISADDYYDVTFRGTFRKRSYEFSAISPTSELYATFDDMNMEWNEDSYGYSANIREEYDWSIIFFAGQHYYDDGSMAVLPCWSNVHEYFPGYFDWYDTFYYTVSDVVILRLMYESQGEVFNVGVVSNIVDPPEQAEGTVTVTDVLGVDCSNAGWIALLILGLILIIVIVVLLWPFWKLLVKGLVWLICAPFKFVRWCYRKCKARSKKRKDKKQQKESEAEQSKIENADEINTDMYSISSDVPSTQSDIDKLYEMFNSKDFKYYLDDLSSDVREAEKDDKGSDKGKKKK